MTRVRYLSHKDSACFALCRGLLTTFLVTAVGHNLTKRIVAIFSCRHRNLEWWLASGLITKATICKSIRLALCRLHLYRSWEGHSHLRFLISPGLIGTGCLTRTTSGRLASHVVIILHALIIFILFVFAIDLNSQVRRKLSFIGLLAILCPISWSLLAATNNPFQVTIALWYLRWLRGLLSLSRRIAMLVRVLAKIILQEWTLSHRRLHLLQLLLIEVIWCSYRGRFVLIDRNCCVCRFKLLDLKRRFTLDGYNWRLLSLLLVLNCVHAVVVKLGLRLNQSTQLAIINYDVSCGALQLTISLKLSAELWWHCASSIHPVRW